VKKLRLSDHRLSDHYVQTTIDKMLAPNRNVTYSCQIEMSPWRIRLCHLRANAEASPRMIRWRDVGLVLLGALGR